jgi:MFS transporter, DHA2 family, methylenomycin A resistance protein
LPLHLFGDRTFSSTASAALLYAGAFFGSVLVFSLDFQGVRGESASVAWLHIAAITASFGFTSVAAGRLAARFGTRGPILAGLVLLCASAWWAAALSPTAPFPVLAPAFVLMGVGAGLVAPSMNAAILASVPVSLAAIGAGVLNASRQIGTAFGVALFAGLFHGDGKATAMRISLLWADVAYLAALALAARACRPVVLCATVVPRQEPT